MSSPSTCVGLTDQHGHAFDVEGAESLAELVARLLLDFVALVEQLEHRLFVGDVAEIRAEHRVERLRDELLHVAETLDHARRPLVVDMHDHRQRQQRLVRVPRDQIDRLQAFIVAMGFAFAGDPMEHEICRGHEDDAAGIRVERVLAGPERLFPNAALAGGYLLAVAEALAGEVLSLSTDVAHDHADVADRHDGLRNHLERGEPAVDEVGAVGQRLILSAASTAGAEKRVGILEVVVEVRRTGIAAHGRRDDLVRRERGAVVNRHDADRVDEHFLRGVVVVSTLHFGADHDGVETADLGKLLPILLDGHRLLLRLGSRQRENVVVGDDDEQGWVDGVDAFAEDRALAAALTADDCTMGIGMTDQKRLGVLEIVALICLPRVWLGGKGSPSRA